MKISDQKVTSKVIVPSSETSKSTTSNQQTDIRNFKEGHTFTGDVIDIRKDQVTIRINGNQIMQAKLAENIELTIGQRVQFVVKENNGELVVLRPVHNDKYPVTGDTTIIRALQAASLPTNANTIELVKQLMQQQMSIDKGTLQKIYQQLVTSNKADIESVVMLNKHGLVATKENIEQFANYKNYEHRISNGIETVAKQTIESLTTLINNNQSKEAIEFNQRLITIITEETNHQNQNSNRPLSDLLNTSEMNKLLNLADKLVQSQSADSSMTGSNILANKDGSIVQNNVPTQEQSKIVTQNQNTDLVNSPTLELLKTNNNNERIQNGTNQLVPSQEELAQGQNSPLHKVTANELLRVLNQIVYNTHKNDSSNSEREVSRLLDSPEYKKILSEHIKNRLFLNPEEVTKEKMSALYEKIEYELKEFRNLAEESPSNDTKLLWTTKGLQDNIEFMKNLNDVFTYIQIPLKLKNQNVNSELYVLTDKEALRKNKGNISALLHLDLNSLGILDIYINKQDNVIQSQFYCSKPEITNMIERNISKLNEAIHEKGYQIYTQVTTRDKKVDFIEDFINAGEEELLIKRYSFDVRA